jgi:uncharacterized protein YegP (UPF0339 family)
MRKVQYFLLYLITILSSFWLQAETPDEIEITAFNNPAPGYIFMDAMKDSIITIYDNSGRAPYYKLFTKYDLDFQASRILENGKFAFYAEGNEIWFIVDNKFNVIDSIGSTPNYHTNFHTLHVSKTGNYLLLSTDTIKINLVGKVPNGKPDVLLFNLVIQEFDAKKNLVFQWSCYDHIDVTNATEDNDLSENLLDPYHINQVVYDSDGNILINFRNLDAVYKINRSTGAIMWVWGGSKARRNDFTFINDTKDGFYGFSHQHDPKRLSNGNILLFDNGNLKPTPMSRAVEYKLDETAMTATKVWEYYHPDALFAEFMGNAQRLPNGNTLIGWGANYTRPFEIINTEVTSSGEKAFEMKKFIYGGNYQSLRYVYNMDAVGLNITSTGSYNFSDSANKTGIVLNVTSLTGSGYTSVEKHHYQPYNIDLGGDNVCSVLPFRWVISSSGIDNLSGKIVLDTKTLPFIKHLSDINVYWRAIENNGTFQKLTSVYSSVTQKLEIDLPGKGEFFLAFKDIYSPDPSTPFNKSINQPINTTIKWSGNLTDDLYILQVSETENFGILIVDTANFSYPYFDLNYLKYNQEYFWRVKTYNDNCESEWSKVRSFQTMLAPPDLVFPMNNMKEAGLKGTLRWAEVDGSLRYKVLLSDKSDFSSVIIEKLVVSNTFLDYSGLEYNKKYYWRVVASSYGSYINWSNTWEFTTYYGKPLLTSPKDSAGFVPLTGNLTWKKLEGSLNYYVQFGIDSLFGNNIIDTVVADINSIQYPKLTNRGRYFWHVKANNGETFSEWSDTWRFDVIFPAPVLRLPANRKINISPKGNLVWETIKEATGYDIQLSTNPEFSVFIINKSVNAGNCGFDNLVFETKYYWRVRATNGEYIGDWSDIWSFTIQPEGMLFSPMITYPQNNQFKTPVVTEIKWIPSYLAEKYDVEISTDIEFKSKIQKFENIETNNLTTEPLDYSQFFFVRLRAKNSKTISDWSEPVLFTTALKEPEIIYPLDKDTNNVINFIFKWAAVDKAKNYHLQVAEDEEFTSLKIDRPGIESTSFDFTDLLEGVYYYWHVAAGNDDNSSEWTATGKLKILINSSVGDPTDEVHSISVYPNPVSNEFTAFFSVAESLHTVVDIIDLSGRVVKVINNGSYEAGDYHYHLSAEEMPEGTYILRFASDNNYRLFKFEVIK